MIIQNIYSFFSLPIWKPYNFNKALDFNNQLSYISLNFHFKANGSKLSGYTPECPKAIIEG